MAASADFDRFFEDSEFGIEEDFDRRDDEDPEYDEYSDWAFYPQQPNEKTLRRQQRNEDLILARAQDAVEYTDLVEKFDRIADKPRPLFIKRFAEHSTHGKHRFTAPWCRERKERDGRDYIVGHRNYRGPQWARENVRDVEDFRAEYEAWSCEVQLQETKRFLPSPSRIDQIEQWIGRDHVTEARTMWFGLSDGDWDNPWIFEEEEAYYLDSLPDWWVNATSNDACFYPPPTWWTEYRHLSTTKSTNDWWYIPEGEPRRDYLSPSDYWDWNHNQYYDDYYDEYYDEYYDDEYSANDEEDRRIRMTEIELYREERIEEELWDQWIKKAWPEYASIPKDIRTLELEDIYHEWNLWWYRTVQKVQIDDGWGEHEDELQKGM